MKKNILLITFLTLFSLFLVIPMANADFIVLDPDTYTPPEYYGTIAPTSTIDLNHYVYYEWYIDDLNYVGVGDTLDIVFHGIYDWRVEEDLISVYIRDGLIGETPGWFSSYDNQSETDPDWSSWVDLGSWYDPVGHYPFMEGPTYDVIFSLVIDSTWQVYLTNNGTFVVGIDPDCHYYGDKISVAAPVTELSTLLLIGTGLLGLAGVGRIRKRN